MPSPDCSGILFCFAKTKKIQRKAGSAAKWRSPKNKKIFPWEDLKKEKNGKRPTSHRYNHIPLLCSHPGGFCRSWSCRTCRCKCTIFLYFRKAEKQISTDILI